VSDGPPAGSAPQGVAPTGVPGDPIGAGARERRLHPFSWLFVLLGQLRQMALPLVALLVFGRGEWWELLGVVAAVALAAHAFVVSLSFRYWLGTRELVVREGLFDRTERHVPFARIQNVVQRQTLLHRLFGVTELRLESAGGANPEAVMNVVTLAAAAELERALRDEVPSLPATADGAEQGLAGLETPVLAPSPADGGGPQEGGVAGPARGRRRSLRSPTNLFRLSLGDTVRFGLISNRGMVLVAAAFGVLFQGGGDPRDLPGLRWLWDLLRESLGSFVDGHGPVELVAAGTVALVGALLLLRLLSVVLALNSLWDFRLDFDGERLTTEHGLLTRIRAGATRAKLQQIAIEEGILHRWFGRQTLRATVAAGVVAVNEGDGTRLRWIAPLVEKGRVPALLTAVEPGILLERLAWQPIHPKAFGRRARRTCQLVALLTAVLVAAVGAEGLLALLTAVPGLFAARRFARRTAWALDDELFAVRLGGYRELVFLVRREKIQAVRLRATPFDRRHGMARVLVDVAGVSEVATAAEVPYLDARVARELAARLAAAAAAGGRAELLRVGRPGWQLPTARSLADTDGQTALAG
jgi:putative membrane protein